MRYLFEDFSLDIERRELRRGGVVIQIEPKVFDLLAYIIQNRDNVLSRDDLLRVVWDGRIVSEAAQTTCINGARRALADSGDAQRLIKTLPRKGIRFVGIVHVEHGAGSTASDVGVSPSKPALTLPDKPSIAVLPFTNMSGDSEQDYFADGMTDDIITELSRFSRCIQKPIFAPGQSRDSVAARSAQQCATRVYTANSRRTPFSQARGADWWRHGDAARG
jgi:DNA-binding winged helix-turn-helix (wHTH) protein